MVAAVDRDDGLPGLLMPAIFGIFVSQNWHVAGLPYLVAPKTESSVFSIGKTPHCRTPTGYGSSSFGKF
jgi:hypothetical protein